MTDTRKRVALVSRIIRNSPSLLLWLICQDTAWSQQPPETFRELAVRFSERIPLDVHWSPNEVAVDSARTASTARWRALTSRSIFVAEGAAALAQAAVEANGSARRLIGQAYLVGLLHAAADWLSSCGPAVRLARGVTRSSPLPAWLVLTLREIHQGPGESGPARFVAQALRQQLHRRDEEPGGSSAGRGNLDDDAETAGLVAAALPELLANLARLKTLETEFQAVLEREKLESLRQFAYGASHEINNPLANISTRAQTLLREETNPERRRRLAAINSQAFRAHEMISDMMLFANPPGLVPCPVDTVKLVDEILAEIKPLADEQGTTLVRTTTEQSLVIMADRVQIGAALKSLCVNSLEAIGVGGTVAVGVFRGPPSPTEPQTGIDVVVRDTGPGIMPETRRHLFDPFFSGREAGRGLGLGLSKCWRIVTLHGGRIDVDSTPGKGATFAIHLPAGQEQPE